MKKSFYAYFITFILSSITFAQTPGGVKGYQYWFSSDQDNDSLAYKKAESLLNYRSIRKIDYKHKFEDISSNKTSGDATVFIVLKPSFQQEQSVITDIMLKNRRISVQSDRITSKDQIKIKNFASEKPFLISYTESIVLDSANYGLAKTPENKDRFEGEIAEIIFYPKFLSKINRRKIETYLSLKHGISLSQNEDYINSAGDTIWKGNENIIFSKRITAIGWDMNGNFNNGQSSNVDDFQFLTIGFGDNIKDQNIKITDTQTDLNYLLWSDNDGDTEFKKDNHSNFPQLLGRVWFAKKIGAVVSSRPVTFKFDFSSIENKHNKEKKDHENENLKYWLISAPGNQETIDLHQADFLKAVDIQEDWLTVEFSDISLARFDDSFLFTLAKAPEMFGLATQTHDNCNMAINLKIIGGTAPYSAFLYDENNQKFIFDKISDSEFAITNLQSKDYICQIIDNEGKIFEEKLLNGLDSPKHFEIPDIYLVKNQVYTLNLNEIGTSDFSNTVWYRDDKNFGTGSIKDINKEGNYHLTYQTEFGCPQTSDFKVYEIPEFDWEGLYPNPVRANENFFIRLTEDTHSAKLITITDQTGRVLKRKIIKPDNNIYSDRFYSKGIYTVTIESNTKTQQYTIIIK